MDSVQHCDIAIIGGGPVGMLLALQLFRAGRNVCLFEARAPETALADPRTLVLSWHSLSRLEQAGVRLGQDGVSDIRQVHISQQSPYARTLLKAEDLDLPKLGAAVDYAVLVRACEAALAEHGVPVRWRTSVTQVQTTAHYAMLTLQNGEIVTTQWAILAEGGGLAENIAGLHTRHFDYHQSALVSTLHFDAPPSGLAYERFSQAGPMALLPYSQAYRLIWTCAPENALQLQQATLAAFNEAFQAAFGARLGSILSKSPSIIFPLVLRQRETVYSGRIICIGNAAQTMHPVAAQGFNLGLRDAVTLARHLLSGSLNDSRLAQRYAAERRMDATAIVAFTHGLVTWFDEPGFALNGARAWAMQTLDHVSMLRRRFGRHLIYGLT